MKILALDQATKTGWAVNGPGGITSGVQDFSLKRGESSGMRYVRFRAWLHDMLAMLKPDLVVYEDSFHRGGASTEIALGFRALIQEECATAEVTITVVKGATLKKFATGKGNASKDVMVEAAKARWPYISIIDDNEADALWLLAYAEEEFNR